MAIGHAPIGAVAICEDFIDTLIDGPYDRMLVNEAVTPVVVLELNIAQKEPPVLLASGDAIGTYAIGVVPGEDVISEATTETRIYADTWFITEDDDTKRPNLIVEPRVKSAIDRTSSKPVVPEATARSQDSRSQATLANSDGELDELIEDYVIDGHVITKYIGPKYQDSRNLKTRDEALGASFSASRDSVAVSVAGPTSYLDRDLTYNTYRGTGGPNGGSELAGVLKPVMFGQCFNVKGVYVDRTSEIFQIHNGLIYAVDAVRDRGIAMTFTSNYSTFYELKLATLNPGEYATCLAGGYVRTNIADIEADPSTDIRIDARGDFSGYEYVDQTGTILLRIAEQHASIVPQKINRPFFFAVRDGAVGYYADGSAPIKISQIFDEMLRPYNGFYGRGNDSRLAIGMSPVIANVGASFNFDESDILELKVLQPPYKPRYRMVYGYKKNWHPHDASELAGSLTDEDVALYSLPYSSVKDERGSVLKAHPEAVSVSDIITHYFEYAPCASRLGAVMDSVSGDELFITIKLGRIGLKVKDTSVIAVTHPRFGLSGSKFSVIGRRNDTRTMTVTLTLRG